MTTAVRAAVDGGQSGLRVRVSGIAEPAIVEGLGRLEGDLGAGLIGRVQAGLAALNVAQEPIERMVLGLTTIPVLAGERLELARQIGQACNVREVRLAGDELLAHAGAFAGAPGVVLTVGTGVACLGFDPASGAMRRVDGDGFLLGDAGAAFWIGSRGVAAVLRASDGRGPATVLTEASRERFGAQEELAAHLHSLPRAVAAIAGFAVEVQRAARAGDVVAGAILVQAAQELVRTALAASAVIATRPSNLACTGRVIAPGTALRAAVEGLLRDEPRLTLVEAGGDPLDGAWALANSDIGDERLAAAYDRHMTGWSMP